MKIVKKKEIKLFDKPLDLSNEKYDMFQEKEV